MVTSTSRWAAMPLLFAFASQGLAAITYKGCYSSSTPMSEADAFTYQSTGHCSGLCLPNQAVMGLTAGNGCWCGSQLPSADSLVDDSKCNTPCTGYGSVNCGGTNYWSVYLTGLLNDVTNYGVSAEVTASSLLSSSTTASATPTTVTSAAAGNTVLVTVSASATASAAPTSTVITSSNSGTSVAGVAAGVVIGVLAIAAIGAGIFFFLRHRRRRQVEDDYKRTHQVDDFMRGAGERKAPNTAYSQMSDSRLDPEAGRRNSVGSMADEHDYSRRILRVANPDSSH